MGRRGYRIWVPETKKVEESHDVTFEEGRAHRTREVEEVEDEQNGEMMGETGKLESMQELGKEDNHLPAITAGDSNHGDQLAEAIDPIQHNESIQVPKHMEPTERGPEPPQPELTRRSDRGHIPSRRYLESKEYEEREKRALDLGDAWTTDSEEKEEPLALIVNHPYAFAATSGELWVPQSFKQAMKRPNLWQEPMEREFKTLVEKNCWDLVPLPPDANLTGGRWTYAIKFDALGNLLKRKA
ncbi:hypothetical protein F5051DRAFT_443910 [Lentinula edodes]|nr:hypothetical protein F5051DRAFT_443910 [Lentinula edodes]